MKNFRLVSVLAIAFLTAEVFADDKCVERKKSPITRFLPDQDFALSFGPEDFISTMMTPWGFRDYFRPWRRFTNSLVRDLGSSIKVDKDQFTINLDVQHFAPEEITVKTSDGQVTIEGKHEEKQDEHGYISRQFIRRYMLPDGVEAETITSNLSSDGVLTISAPKKTIEGTKERIVPVTQTGPVRKEAIADQGSCQSEVCVSDE